MIQVRIRKRFAAGKDATGFSLDMEFAAGPGITVLFGPSGAGKTLTLDAIAGFVRPDDGRILLDDQILFDGASGVHLTPQARRCGYVFQNYALFPHMTLRQNLEFAMHATPGLERRQKVNELLDRFHLAEVAGRRPHQLSGGQKQRCSIARALAGSPRLLLFDEPARGLDAPLRSELYAILRQVRREFQAPLILVTHDFNECMELADEMLVVRDGKVLQSGPPRKMFEQPLNAEIARLLGIFNVLPVEIRALDPGRNTSRLRYQEFEIQGPYFPGRLIGDRVSLCVRPEQLVARPRSSKPGVNQIPAVLTRIIDKPQGLRLEFADDISVEAPASTVGELQDVKEWLIEFPQKGLRVV